jgi:hypothetical protein
VEILIKIHDTVCLVGMATELHLLCNSWMWGVPDPKSSVAKYSLAHKKRSVHHLVPHCLWIAVLPSVGSVSVLPNCSCPCPSSLSNSLMNQHLCCRWDFQLSK